MGKIIHIINVLQHYSSKTRPLSALEITNYLNDFYAIGDTTFIDLSTTTRALNTYLMENNYLYSISGNIMPLHYTIHVLIQNKNAISDGHNYTDITTEYLSESKSLGRKKKHPKLFYYYEPIIPIDEIINLINMVESHPYYSSQEVVEITTMLKKSIAPAYFEQPQMEPQATQRLRANDATLQNNLHILHSLIHKQEDITIEYSYYNDKKELIPHKGYPQRVTPYKIVWANGYCYLIAYNPHYNGITNYRVDRITYIEA